MPRLVLQNGSGDGRRSPAPPQGAPRLPVKNVRPTAYGFQLYTRVRGRFVSEHWKGTTPPTALEVRDWKHLQHATIKNDLELPAADGEMFGESVERYVALVATMPTLRWRKDDLALWLHVFGAGRARSTITGAEIRAQLERWRSSGYAASTVNHRRTALMHLWTVLDGKTAPNPARDVPRYREDNRPPAPLTAAAIDAALDAMPDGLPKARLVLMRWTGWPQAQIGRLEPGHIAWNRAVFLSRRKGKGIEGRWLPLLPQAWRALRAFKKVGAWGPIDTSNLRAAFRRGAAKAAKNRRLTKAVRAELADVTPYQLRHTFGTLVAGMTQDDRAVQTLMLHSDIRQTHRYTGTTVDPRTAAALRKVVSSIKVAKVAQNRLAAIQKAVKAAKRVHDRL